MLTPVILAPGACRPQGPTRPPCCISGALPAFPGLFRRCVRRIPRSHILLLFTMILAHFAGKWRPIFNKIKKAHQRSPQGAPGSPQDPPGSPQGLPRVPWGSPRVAPGSLRSLTGAPLYTQNSRSTAPAAVTCIYHILHIIYYILYITYYILYIIYYMLYLIYSILYVIYHILYII